MKALLVDGFNLVRRIFAAVPMPEVEIGAEQRHIEGVIQSTVSSLKRALRFHQPSHCVVVFEQSGRTWRHQLFPDYKKKRSAMPISLSDAMDALRLAIGDARVNCFERTGFEADDVIATMSVKIAESDGKAVILSTDRNYCQLLSDNIKVYDHFGKRFLDQQMVFKRFGVGPEQLPFLLALAGDSGMSIPGIPGIGIRTAARLVSEYHSLEPLLAASKEMTGKIGSKIYSGRESARLGLQLFTLKSDIDLGINLSQFRYSPATTD